MSTIEDQLQAVVGNKGFVSGASLRGRATSYWDPSPTQATCLIRPASTAEVSEVLKLCHAAGQSVVVQGGLTGVVKGAEAQESDVIVSLERMNEIESVDALDGVAVIQAGCILQTVQEQLAERDFLFPLDLGARGSCTIGGNIATNAGGINVLRYGMIRNSVLGLEVVLADGTVVSSMNQMLKNNAGYDLKQLFIGSEGTLGIVTRAVIKLTTLPKSRQTALLAVDSFAAVTRVLNTSQSLLAGTLSAFEVMWRDYFVGVTGAGGHSAPLSRDHPYYLLLESEGADVAADAARFEDMLGQLLEQGDVLDAVIPKSESERKAIWAIREDFESVLPAYLYDVSLPIRSMPEYVERLSSRLKEWHDEASGMVFGHIADGNLHIFVGPFDDGKNQAIADNIVYSSLEGLEGSVSAEHGIGLDKKAWLGSTRSETEIALMRQLKSMLDPDNILNPGRIID